LFHSFSKSWEAEIGGRYLGFDTLNSISGVASLARYFGDFWLNLKGYATFVSEKQYFAANLTLRQYLQSRTDFFYTTFGYGNTPDDFSRAFQLDKLITFTTYSIGGGYQKVFNYRNTLSINGTWFNQRTDEHRYRNQYDIYVTFFRRF
jgi:YaiO family outer membrane protein